MQTPFRATKSRAQEASGAIAGDRPKAYLFGIQNPGDFITNWLIPGLGMLDQNRAEQEAREANELQQQQILQGYSDLYGPSGGTSLNTKAAQFAVSQRETAQRALQRAQEGAGSLQDSVASGYSSLNDAASSRTGSVLGRLGAGQSAIGQGYSQRTGDVMGLISGLGAQGEANIRRDVSAMTGRSEQDLLSRGLGGSTALAATRGYGERVAQDALNEHRERVRGQQAGYLADLTGEALSADERMLDAYAGYESGLTGDELAYQNAGIGATERLGTFGLGLQQDAYNQLLRANQAGAAARMGTQEAGGLGRIGAIAALNHEYPDQNAYSNWMQHLGQARADTPDTGTNAWDWTNMGIQAAGLVAAPFTAGLSIPAAAAASGGVSAIGQGMGRSMSARKFKHSIEAASDDEFLEMADRLSVMRWQYKHEPGQHVGPMAEDFKDVTGLGDGMVIPHVDAHGVLLGAVRALSKKVKQLEAALAEK